jgi:hydrogenase maturation protein HypF
MALAHLHAAEFDVASPDLLNMLGATEMEAHLLLRMIKRNLNAPLTSSLGRLFDAVAAVVLNRRVVDYEAQAAIELEGFAVDEPDTFDGYAFGLEGNWEQCEPLRINAAQMWTALLDDLRSGVNKAHMAARFHSGIARAFVRVAELARKATGIGVVALSGGVMHNRRLARLLRVGLEAEGFQVFQQRRVSPGDGGLSYGQAAAAAAMLTKG